MIPALGWMVAAYAVARLANTALFDGENHRMMRQWIAALAIVVVIWAAIRIEQLGTSVAGF